MLTRDGPAGYAQIMPIGAGAKIYGRLKCCQVSCHAGAGACPWRTNCMNTLLYLLPILSVILLAGARLLEIRTKRAEVIKGPVKEHLTFQLFVAVGGLIALCSILEYVLAG